MVNCKENKKEWFEVKSWSYHGITPNLKDCIKFYWEAVQKANDFEIVKIAEINFSTKNSDKINLICFYFPQQQILIQVKMIFLLDFNN